MYVRGNEVSLRDGELYVRAVDVATLMRQPSYDADTTNPANPLGSPWSEADNSAGDFSPSLLIQEARNGSVEIPVAGTSGLAILGTILALTGLILLRARLA